MENIKHNSLENWVKILKDLKKEGPVKETYGCINFVADALNSGRPFSYLNGITFNVYNEEKNAYDSYAITLNASIISLSIIEAYKANNLPPIIGNNDMLELAEYCSANFNEFDFERLPKYYRESIKIFAANLLKDSLCKESSKSFLTFNNYARSEQ